MSYGRVLRNFAALFFLFLSYYLIKPLRNSQFLKEFPPHALPLVYLVVSLLSLGVTRMFQWAEPRLSRRTLVAATFAWAALGKLYFYFALPQAGQSGTVQFYLFASVYFLLLVSTLWGCLNERFLPDQASRCFAWIALGSTLGGIAGAQAAHWMADGRWGYGCLLWSALALVCSLLLLWPELHWPVVSPPRSTRPGCDDPWYQEVSLRAIATMVLCLAIFSTALDLISQQRLDEALGTRVYAEQISPGMPGWSAGTAEFSRLRGYPESQRRERLAEMARQAGVSPPQMELLFGHYQKQLEMGLRTTFASISRGQGILGVVVLCLLCRPFLMRFGLAPSLRFLPSFALVALPLLLLPLEVVWVEWIVILSGTLNYSFNNATKEVLYTAAPRSMLMQAKPFIEGPLMRLGDVLCAVITLACAGLIRGLGRAHGEAAMLMVALCWGTILYWWWQVGRAGQAYQHLLSARDTIPPPPETALREAADEATARPTR